MSNVLATKRKSYKEYNDDFEYLTLTSSSRKVNLGELIFQS